MLVVDKEGYILKANRRFYDVLGYSEIELKGVRIWDLLIKDDYELTKKEVENVDAGLISKSFVNRYKRKNGKIAYIEWDSYPDLQEKITYGIGNDITENLFSDSSLQDLALSIPGTIFKLKKTNFGTYEFVFSNQRLIGLFSDGKTNQDFMSFLDTLSEESQFIFLKELDNSEKDLKPLSFNVFLKSKPDEIYQININPYKEDRNIVFYGVSTLISKAYRQSSLNKVKLKNQILNKNKGYYSIKLYDFNLDYDFDKKLKIYLNSVIIDCNQFFANAYGFNKDEIIGKKISEINIPYKDIVSYLTRLIDNNYNLLNNITYNEQTNIYYSTFVSTTIEDNYLINISGYFEDVSSQLLKQKQLERSERNFRDLFENSPVGIIISNDKNILNANSYVSELFRLSIDELKTMSIQDFISENHLNSFIDIQKNILKNGKLEGEPKIIKLVFNNDFRYIQLTGHKLNYSDKSGTDYKCIQYIFSDVSDKVQYQKENEKNQLLLKSVLDNTTNYIVRVNSKGVFTFCNERYREKIGKDIIGLDFKNNLAPGQDDYLNQKIASLLKDPNNKINLNLNKINSNGEPFLANWDFITVFEGGELFIQCIGRDITEINRIQYELEVANQKYEESAKLAKLAYWEFIPQMDFVYWDDNLYKILGYNKDISLNLEFAKSLVNEKYLNNFENNLKLAIESKEIIFYEYELKKADGNYIFVSGFLKAIYDRNDSLVKITATLQDISELRNKEKKLKSQEISIYQLEDVINQSSIVSYTNLEGKIIDVNKKFTEIYGYSKEEIINADHKILSSDKHSKEFWAKFWETILEGKIWTGEICNLSKDGKELWFYATIFPLKDADGNILNFLEILIDISLSKKYENELEQQVIKRTNQLQESNEEKDFILQMVSHDLKNPITGIILQCELLKTYIDIKTQPNVLKKVNYIIDSSKRMNLIINNLLEFDSINKNSNLLINKVDLKEIISKVKSIFETRLEQKSQKLIIDIPEEEIYVQSNKNYLYQIIENLLSNASKFSQTNSSITIKVFRDKNNIKISIEDQGPGIKPEDQKQLFKKFAKLSNKPTGGEVSSGLGLAIVKKLCDLLNHKISVESTVNIGTIFTVSLKNNSKNSIPKNNGEIK